jgi:uncharacterized protein involved in tolerance to divalent cations
MELDRHKRIRKEIFITYKSKKTLTKEIYKGIKKIHSYDTLEFAIYELTSPSEEYLD